MRIFSYKADIRYLYIRLLHHLKICISVRIDENKSLVRCFQSQKSGYIVGEDDNRIKENVFGIKGKESRRINSLLLINSATSYWNSQKGRPQIITKLQKGW